MFKLTILFVFFFASVCDAQITFDGSLGTAGSLVGPNFVIPSNRGETRGSNLFHSFGLFNVFTGQSATFMGSNSITNIFGRVTGGQQSIIDGTIRSTIPNANLFLMNPAGMIFGPTASLNVQGSFHATTADYLKFADGAKFHADLSKQSTLTSAAVSAFGFLSQNPAGISVEGSLLQLTAGRTLSLVGGDIDIVGDPFLTQQGFPTLSAFGGKVQLASVASPGEVPLNFQDLNLAAFERLGQIDLTNSAYIDASNITGGAVGTVVIRGGRLAIDSSIIATENVGNLNGLGNGVDINVTGDATITNQSLIASDSLAAGRARDVQITAGTLRIDNSEIRSLSFASGGSGKISVNLGSLELTGTAFIGTRALASGNAGTVQVTATDSINLGGNNTLITSSTSAGSTGNAGDVTVEAKSITVTGGAQIFSGTSGAGNAGTVQVTAADSINIDGNNTLITSSSSAGSTGNAGDVIVEAKSITATGGAQIFSGTMGAGNGGMLRVTASDAISLVGTGIFPSGIIATTEATGNAGNIIIDATSVSLTGGAQIFGGTFGSGNGGTVQVNSSDVIILNGAGSQITSASQQGSSGDAGSLTVGAKNITITNGAQIFSGTSGAGNGGTVQVAVNDTVSLSGNSSQIAASAEAGSTGNAGDVIVQAKNVFLTDQGAIRGDISGSGNGGTVRVIAAEDLTLDNGKIFAQSLPGSLGNAGTVVVQAPQITAVAGAQIGSSTFGSGNAGALQVTATDTISLDGINFDAQGIPFASGIFSNANPGSTGNAGELTISTKNLKVTGGAQVGSGTFSAGDGGTIRISASDTITVDGRTVLNGVVAVSGIFVSAEASATGNAGDLVIDAGRLLLNHGAQIVSGTSGPGKGGNVQIAAANAINLDGTSGGIFASTERGSSGDAGNITLQAKELVLNGADITSSTNGSGKAGSLVIEAENVTAKGGGQISSSTFGSGKGGTVRVTASESISLEGFGPSADGTETIASGIFANANPGSTNDAGSLVITAKNLSVAGGGEVASNTFASGNAGVINVTASGAIAVDGSATVNGQSFQSQISSSTSDGSSGKAGDVFVGAHNVNLTNGGSISTNTKGGGNGGTVQVTANDTVNLAGDSIISSSSSGAGAGGSVDVQARQINLNDSALITAASSGSGNAGNINMVATDSFLAFDSAVKTSAAVADGGNIHLKAGRLVRLVNSQITTSVQSGVGAGGNILIDPQFVILNHSQITANAFGGPGGNITIIADNFLASADSIVTASSALSTSGTVDIQARIVDLSGSIAPLPDAILQASTLLRQSCAARYSSGKASSLAAVGRDSTPYEPGGLLAGSLFTSANFSTSQNTSEAILIASAHPKFSIASPCVTLY